VDLSSPSNRHAAISLVATTSVALANSPFSPTTTVAAATPTSPTTSATSIACSSPGAGAAEAAIVAQPFDDPEWIFEMKWDGYRALARVDPGVSHWVRGQFPFATGMPPGE
jgi:bifunctional non-homologous end joining protein LigD